MAQCSYVWKPMAASTLAQELLQEHPDVETHKVINLQLEYPLERALLKVVFIIDMLGSTGDWEKVELIMYQMLRRKL